MKLKSIYKDNAFKVYDTLAKRHRIQNMRVTSHNMAQKCLLYCELKMFVMSDKADIKFWKGTKQFIKENF